jgi:hypothetical protein
MAQSFENPAASSPHRSRPRGLAIASSPPRALEEAGDIPDWREARSYEQLLGVEKPALAWEWLRRDPGYRDAALESIGHADRRGAVSAAAAPRWNLHAFADPRLAAPLARPLWAAPACGWVVRTIATRGRDGEDVLDLKELAGFATLTRSPAAQHLLLSDGRRSIRLDVIGDELEGSPVKLAYLLHGVEDLARPLLVLERLRSLILQKRFVSSLYPPVRRARREVMLLRAFDAIQAGASQADIAELLLSRRFERRSWRIHSPSLRSQAQRLVRASRAMASGGFWDLLG